MKTVLPPQLFFLLLSAIFLIVEAFLHFYDPARPISWFEYGSFPEALLFILLFTLPAIIFSCLMLYLRIKGLAWKIVALILYLVFIIIWMIPVAILSGNLDSGFSSISIGTIGIESLLAALSGILYLIASIIGIHSLTRTY